MSTFKEVCEYLDSVFPFSDSETWDNDGIDICVDENAEIKKIVLALDVTSKIIAEAKEENADLIITHHPLLFNKTDSIVTSDIVGKRVLSLITQKISCISFHTRLDKHEGGVTDSLCDRLGLKKEYKICNGLANICYVDETDFDAFASNIKNAIGSSIRVFNNNGKAKKIAVCGGGGKSLLDDVALEGVDTYITGEVDHNKIIDASEYGVNLILGGHYATEALVLPYLKNVINQQFPHIEVKIKYSDEFSENSL